MCERQVTRDSAAAAAIVAAGGQAGRGGGRGVSIADTTTLRWLEKQGVAAILLADTNHVGGTIATNNGASRVKGALRGSSRAPTSSRVSTACRASRRA